MQWAVGEGGPGKVPPEARAEACPQRVHVLALPKSCCRRGWLVHRAQCLHCLKLSRVVRKWFVAHASPRKCKALLVGHDGVLCRGQAFEARAGVLRLSGLLRHVLL